VTRIQSRHWFKFVPEKQRVYMSRWLRETIAPESVQIEDRY